MSGSNTAISRRRLLQGAGAMWLLSVSQVSLAAVSQVVAVRVWPASSYTRVTVESNRQLKYKQFALSNPERVVVDIEDVNGLQGIWAIECYNYDTVNECAEGEDTVFFDTMLRHGTDIS